MLRAVAFDAADTLFHNPALPQALATPALQSGWNGTHAAMSAAIARTGSRGLWPDDSATHAERVERWQRFFAVAVAEAGITDPTIAAQCARSAALHVSDPASYKLFPDVEPTFSALRQLGYAIGVISNFDPLLRDIIANLGLAGQLDAVITSFDVKCYKPDRRIFQAAAAQLRVPLTQMAFVGDSIYSDMHGASAAGMRNILIDRYDAHHGYRGERVSLLVKVPGLLGSAASAARGS